MSPFYGSKGASGKLFDEPHGLGIQFRVFLKAMTVNKANSPTRIAPQEANDKTSVKQVVVPGGMSCFAEGLVFPGRIVGGCPSAVIAWNVWPQLFSETF